MMMAGSRPPDEFVKQLKQVLDHFYDFTYLQNHTFSEWFPGASRSGSTNAQVIRQLVLAAIERMAPEESLSPRSPGARSYYLLVQRYVEARPAVDVSRDLGIVVRQFYRDQKAAITALASVLWSAVSAGRETIAEEAQRVSLTGSADLVDVNDLLATLHGQVVGALPKAMPCRLEMRRPAEPLVVRTNRTLLRQAVLQVVDSALQASEGIQATMAAYRRGSWVYVELHLLDSDAGRLATQLEPCLAVVRQILTPIGGQVTVRAVPGGPHVRVVLVLPADQPTALVVDDNVEAIRLIERYLASQNCHVLSASCALEATRLLSQERVDLIILDVMMPTVDGWELLHRLRSDGPTAAIPIVVCSVLPQEALSDALGASAYLRKPFSRQDLLACVRPFLGGPLSGSDRRASPQSGRSPAA